MAIRRCLQLQALTRQPHPTFSLFTNSSSHRSLSIAAYPIANISTPNLPIFTDSKPTSAFTQCSHLRYFCSTKQDDKHMKQQDDTSEEEEEDDCEEDEEEDWEDEDGDGDDCVSVSNRKKVYTPEEKEAEAADIGYKVVGALQKDDQVFKPYEPVFAVVQVQFANCLILCIFVSFLFPNECFYLSIDLGWFAPV